MKFQLTFYPVVHEHMNIHIQSLILPFLPNNKDQATEKQATLILLHLTCHWTYVILHNSFNLYSFDTKVLVQNIMEKEIDKKIIIFRPESAESES